jgi:magnesium-transporting ATPase (P-type)
LSLIETIADSPISAGIAVATIVTAISHELAVASRRPRALEFAKRIWGPYLILLFLFAIVVVARLANIFSA